MTGKDLLGRDLTPTEARLLDAYEQLKALLEIDDLPPMAKAGVREAVASLWQVVYGLALTQDRPLL